MSMEYYIKQAILNLDSDKPLKVRSAFLIKAFLDNISTCNDYRVGSADIKGFLDVLGWIYSDKHYCSKFTQNYLTTMLEKSNFSQGQIKLIKKYVTAAKKDMFSANEFEDLLDNDDLGPENDDATFSSRRRGYQCKLRYELMFSLFKTEADNYVKNYKMSKADRDYQKKIAKLESMFSLNEIETKILELIYLIDSYSCCKLLFDEQLDLNKDSEILAAIYETSISNIKESLDKLENYGLVCSCRAYHLSSFANKILNSDSQNVIDEAFKFNGSDTELKADEIEKDKNKLTLLRKLLGSKEICPVNILLYGDPGTGKSSIVGALAKELKLDVYSVNSDVDDNEQDRRSKLLACQKITENKDNCLIVIDEAERLLNTSYEIRNSKDKAWLNAFLEQKQSAPKIWITNDVSEIDSAVKRRFNLSIKFSIKEVQKRICIWKSIAKKYPKAKLTSRVISDFNKKYVTSPAVIEQSLKAACALFESPKEIKNMLECQLQANITLNNQNKGCGFLFGPLSGGEDADNNKDIKKKTDIKRFSEFNKEAVCFKQDIDVFLNGCKKLSSIIKKGKSKKGMGTMLFYGPAGTGKTELSRFIGHEVNMRVKVVRASDILDMYVGQSEKNIAELFYELDIKNEILVIDEIDGLIFDRSNAKAQWQISQVNEFLTHLEECKGFVICTTNYIDKLDRAVLRRFSTKIEFTYANEKQKLALFETELLPLAHDKFTDEDKLRLSKIKYLTPGDFHVIKAMHTGIFANEDSLCNSVFLSELENEAKLKNIEEHQGKKIGFLG